MTDLTFRRALQDMRTLMRIIWPHRDKLTDAQKAEVARIRSFWKDRLEEDKIRQVQIQVNNALNTEPKPTDIQELIDRLGSP